MSIFGWARKRQAALDKLEITPTPAQRAWTTPDRPWVNLTDKQVQACVDASYFHTAWSSDLDVPTLVANLSQKLRELNT